MTGGYRKIKLFSLMVALIVAGLAVVGGTWAWGVDYNEEGETVSDEYKVRFEYYKEGYTSAVGQKLFSNSAWCPGRTEIIYFKLENEEEFPVNATVKLNVTKNEFGNMMSYAVLKNVDLKAAGASHPESWIKFSTAEHAEKVIMNSNEKEYTLLFRQALAPAGRTVNDQNNQVANDVYYLAFALHMDESASSTYEKAELDLNFTLQVDADYQPQTTFSTPQNWQ